MGKSLIIVESPTKTKTLKKLLGNKFIYASSVGHIRDLPAKGFGIDVENNFEPIYQTLPDKKDVIEELKKGAKNADIVYLAPDPDREGEAIAWHIRSILPKNTKVKRVAFNAFTRSAVEEALAHPREINQSLVDAQQARRLLDRIVGYKISPILTRRVRGGREGGLSAGRVQSVALKLVVDREKEIDAFIPIEYWTLSCSLETEKKDPPFDAVLHSIDGKRVEKEEKKGCVTIPNQQTAYDLLKKLEKAHYKIDSIEKKEKKRNPVPPFITSTLQQEASRHFGFAAQRTMSIAQSLYEGVDLGSSGTEGLITYMRTDSVRVAPEGIQAARGYVHSEYGPDYLPDQPNFYATKKSAQDAHEAIRPTNIDYTPDAIKNFLTDDQYKLYKLIWRRFVASQMMPAIYDTVTVDIGTNQKMVLRSTGSNIKFKGFLTLYEEKQDYEAISSEKEGKLLPFLKEGQKLQLLEVKPEQSFTRPPPRFTEASLVKELEKSGVGRPSTYAAIMGKIQSRDYTVKEKGALKPTELGKVIAQMLETHFSMVMDIGFTAAMEDDLENIGEHNLNWKDLIRVFWDHFIPTVETAEKEAFVPKEMTDIDCPECGKKLQKVWAKGKYFYGCSGYPECSFTSPLEGLNFNKEDYAPNFDWDQPCPKCGGEMKLRHGRFGPFLGCLKYPKCKGIVNIPKKDDPIAEDMPDCPAIGCDGKLQMRRSRFGKIFFSCSNYPDCDVIVNDLADLPTKYANHQKTPYVKKARKGGGRPQRAYTLSKELQAITGEKSLSRPEVTKKLWEYIKKHNLQDPKNKRSIVPDKTLAKVFGSDQPVDMMKMAGLLTPHLSLAN